jgi:hypothetical protein
VKEKENYDHQLMIKYILHPFELGYVYSVATVEHMSRGQKVHGSIRRLRHERWVTSVFGKKASLYGYNIKCAKSFDNQVPVPWD